MDDSAHIDHTNQNVFVVNRKHHKWALQQAEPHSDNLNTSEYPICHIPHKQAVKTNQAQPKKSDRDDNSNSYSSNYQILLQIILIG